LFPETAPPSAGPFRVSRNGRGTCIVVETFAQISSAAYSAAIFVILFGMQAVILAAGRGSRMGDLTAAMPKPMLEVAGKTLLEHKFDALPNDVDEIVLIVGYHGRVIQQRFGGEYKGRRLLYVDQENPAGGTADALWHAESVLKDKFLVMNGDNIYSREDMAKCAVYEWAVLVQEKESIATGRVLVDKDGFVKGIAENSEHAGEKGYANTALYVLDRRIFGYAPVPKAAGSSELGLPQTMMLAANDIPIKAVEATLWIEIKTPEDISKAEEILKSR